MKKVIFVIALAAFSFGSVYAHSSTVKANTLADSTKKKVKVKDGKRKEKIKNDTTKIKIKKKVDKSPM